MHLFKQMCRKIEPDARLKRQHDTDDNISVIKKLRQDPLLDDIK